MRTSPYYDVGGAASAAPGRRRRGGLPPLAEQQAWTATSEQAFDVCTYVLYIYDI